jgi:hypothetical protein
VPAIETSVLMIIAVSAARNRDANPDAVARVSDSATTNKIVA